MSLSYAPAMTDVASRFGHSLRRWRRRAGLSQLELAARSGTTPRHVSFLETGRSRPGADIVLRLAATLELPLADRNALLDAAGLPPAFALRPLDDAAMRPLKRVLDRVLAQHEPYPAWVYAHGLRALAANTAAEALFPGLCAMAPEAIIDLWCAPGPFRALVENWVEVMWAGIDSLRREARRTADARIIALLERAEAHAGGIPRPVSSLDAELPVVCPRFRIGGQIIRTISTVMRFDTAIEISASELRIELMFPADDASAAYFRDRAASRGAG